MRQERERWEERGNGVGRKEDFDWRLTMRKNPLSISATLKVTDGVYMLKRFRGIFKLLRLSLHDRLMFNALAGVNRSSPDYFSMEQHDYSEPYVRQKK